MKRKRYTEEQITDALRQAESGAKVVEICRRTRYGGSRPLRRFSPDLSTVQTPDPR